MTDPIIAGLVDQLASIVEDIRDHIHRHGIVLDPGNRYKLAIIELDLAELRQSQPE